MKLHLPKVLLLITLSVGCLNAKTLNVGTGTSLKTEKSGFTVEDGEKVGYLNSANDNFVTSSPSTSNYSNNLLVKGDLTIKDGGEVKIIGKQASDKLSSLRVTGTVTVGALNDKGGAVLAASDCQIENLTINNGSVSLHTGSSDFTQGNGYLGAAAGVYTGLFESSVQGFYSTVGAPKQAQILSNLTINGGSLVMGSLGSFKQEYNAYINSYLNKEHYTNGFGAPNYSYKGFGVPERSLTLTQKAGTMEVYGFSIANSGMKINQSGGTMLFRDLLQFEGSKENVITQSGGSLAIGRLGGDTASVKIDQTGAGELLLAYGTEFSKSGSVVINQTGGGLITLGGGHQEGVTLTKDYADVFSGFTSTETTYTIAQTENGGSLVLAENVDILAGTITQSAGSINVSKGASITANTVTVGGTFNVDKGGSLEAGAIEVNNGGSLNVDSMSVDGTLTNNGTVQAAGQVTATGTVDNKNNMKVQTLVINSGTTTNAKGATLTAGSITVNEGATLINHGTISSASGMMLLAEGDDIAAMNDATSNLITIAGGKMEQYGVTTDNILVQNGGTLTLGVVDGVTTPTSVGAVTLEKGANMKVEGNSTTGALTLNGGTITFTYGATLVSSSVEGMDKVEITVNLSDAALADIKAGNGFDMTLFTVKNETASSSALTGATVNFVSTSGGKAEATVKQDSEGKVTIGQLVPEPTTATLSLLALAALAARRRRAA